MIFMIGRFNIRGRPKKILMYCVKDDTSKKEATDDGDESKKITYDELRLF